MSLTEIGREAADATSESGGGTTNEDYERIDVSGMDFIKMHPGPTAIKGVAKGLRYLPPAPDENSEYDDNDRGSAGLVLGAPTIPDDDDIDDVGVFKASDGQTGDDFKVVNVEDDSIDTYEVGISVGTMFESEEVDDFGIDEGILTLSTSAGRSAVRTLDVRGLANADVLRNDDGEPDIQDNGYPTTNDALIETHPDNDNDSYTQPRYARDPQIRPDVEGEEIIILLQRLSEVDEDYDGNSHWVTVLANLDDDRQQELAEEYAEDGYYEPEEPEAFIREFNGTEYLRLAPTMEFEPDDALLQSTQWMEWRWPSEERTEELAEKQGVSQ